MSTTVKHFASGDSTVTLFRRPSAPPNVITVRAEQPNSAPVYVTVDQAEFLAAVGPECDAIIIDKATLPVVDARGDMLIAELDIEERGAASVARLSHDAPNSHPEWHRAKANAHLALAEYLDSHPPVDEAQVKALTDALYAATADPDDIDVPDIARRLLATGRVTITEAAPR